MLDTIAIWLEEDESPGWRDPQGLGWKLARTSDGTWWKKRWSNWDRS
jgi:hypothetical protein